MHSEHIIRMIGIAGWLAFLSCVFLALLLTYIPQPSRLASRLTHEDKSIREKAVRRLLQIGMPRAIPPLLDLLANERAEVRERAAVVLVKLHWEPETLEQRIPYLVARHAWGELIELLANARAEVRESVADILDKLHWEPESLDERILHLGARRAWGEAISLLVDARVEVRKNVARALGKLPWKPETLGLRILHVVARHAWGAAIELLANAPVEVRENVAGVLRRLPRGPGTLEQRMLCLVAEHAWGELVELLADACGDVRKSAAMALHRLNWEPETLEERIFYFVSTQAWGELIAMGGQSVRPLLGVFAASDRQTQQAIVKAWVEKGMPHTDVLVTAIQDDNLQRCAAALLGIARDAATVEPLIRLLRGKSLLVRETAVYALGLIGDASAVESLQVCWRTTDVEHLSLRRAARWALHRIDPSQSPGGEPGPVWLPWFHEIWVPKSWEKRPLQ